MGIVGLAMAPKGRKAKVAANGGGVASKAPLQKKALKEDASLLEKFEHDEASV